MAVEETTTWVCDRCGARSHKPEGWALARAQELWVAAVAVESWHLCATCWRSYRAWMRTPRAKEAASD